MGNMTRAIAMHFPHGTKITAPQGGLLLWVQLDRTIDSMALYQEARAKGISILPGAICASTNAYKNCIRVSCGRPWDERVEEGIASIGRLIKEMMTRV